MSSRNQSNVASVQSTMILSGGTVSIGTLTMAQNATSVGTGASATAAVTVGGAIATISNLQMGAVSGLTTNTISNTIAVTTGSLTINNYTATEQSWRQFCAIGTLSDFRPHNRYSFGGFSDLVDVDETGEYQDGQLTDAEKAYIQASSQGRILNLSREMIINDDMGVFVSISSKMGQAAGRTVEKRVYSVLTANAALSQDNVALFHADHANLASPGTVVSTQSFDDAAVAMSAQMDPAGNDFLDIVPAIWLGPRKYKGDADVVNASKYEVTPGTPQRFEVPNKSVGLFQKIVGTPRLTGTAWYAFADPNVEAAIEVGFLDGQQEPQVAMEQNFRSNGVAYRVSLDYGVAAVGYRGAYKNPGA